MKLEDGGGLCGIVIFLSWIVLISELDCWIVDRSCCIEKAPECCAIVVVLTPERHCYVLCPKKVGREVMHSAHSLACNIPA